ncbi:hypothetical protein [Qaidamihabitans albus]|uniref:hypothetical protein n=1 Tax=Qaidamihabitans albus TaxID=2795733 RepID=UPI0018F1F06F|nr:hypothetical protein [Qaidamihabitans albus]
MMIVCGLVVSSGLLLAGLFGQRAGRFACPWCARLSLAALSAVLVAMAVALWW